MSDALTPPPGTIPAAEVDIGPALVAGLVEDQHPALAGRPVVLASHGWDNDTYRLGDDLAVRLPRRASAVPLLENEQRWLADLAPHVPVPVPVPLHAGGPGRGYPWGWSIVPWIDGVPAEHEPIHPAHAGDLGRCLAGVHAAPIPVDPPANPVRGVRLGARRESVVSRLDRLRAVGQGSTVLDRALEVFEAGDASPQDADPGWLHGDPHPRNVLTREGRLAGLIDWGDLCVGDQATDLAAPWLHLPVHAHDGFWVGYGPASEATLRRAHGWAAFFGVVLLDVGLDHDEGFARIGRTILDRVVA